MSLIKLTHFKDDLRPFTIGVCGDYYPTTRGDLTICGHCQYEELPHIVKHLLAFLDNPREQVFRATQNGPETPGKTPDHDVQKCMACGHPKEFHERVVTQVAGCPNQCVVIDADGPCMCPGFKPCSHVATSRVSRRDTEGRAKTYLTCMCGERKIDITTHNDDYSRGVVDGKLAALATPPCIARQRGIVTDGV